ncbi:MAG: DUF6340 family protein [Gammaproteobacteria bacterium]|nr:DUF6340 family protein [Gammaproteobacteria bacterium]MDH5652020.1 DUF6340 family protein [Gammaproteobacteria bacterium]
MKKFFPLLISGLVFLSGCSTQVSLMVQRAPEINLKEIRTLNVKPFSVAGTLNLDLDNQAATPQKMSDKKFALEVVKLLLDVNDAKSAQSYIDKQHAEIQETHLRDLTKAIFRNGHFKVNNGNQYQAQLTGDINYDVQDVMETQENKDKHGKVTVSYKLTRTANVAIQFNVLDSNGTMLGTTTVTTKTSDSTTAGDKSKARKKTMDWPFLVKKAIAALHESTINKIAPYYIKETRTLAEGDMKLIKDGNKAAADNNWPTAISLWQTVAKAGNNKDKAAALYNLSVYDELQGDFTHALDKANKASSLHKQKRYTEQVQTLHRRIAEAKEVKELLNK